MLSRMPEARINHKTVTANLAASLIVPKSASNASFKGIAGGYTRKKSGGTEAVNNRNTGGISHAR